MGVYQEKGWVYGYEWLPTENCGGYPEPNAEPKKLWHTTESGFGSFRAINRLFADAVYNSPHFCVDPGTWGMAQYGGMNFAACALEHPGGYPHTNGVPVIQTEICGFAADSQNWNDNVLLFLAKHAVNVRRAQQEIMGRSFSHTLYVQFFGQNAGFTLATRDARQRVQGHAWIVLPGHCGHQHAPGNVHWDPGALNVQRICDLANLIEMGGGDVINSPISLSEWEEWFNMKTDEEVKAAMKQAAKEAMMEVVPPGILSGSWENDTRDRMGSAVFVYTDGDKKGQQFMVDYDRDGEFKVHLDTMPAHELFKAAGIIRRASNLIPISEQSDMGKVLTGLPTRDQ